MCTRARSYRFCLCKKKLWVECVMRILVDSNRWVEIVLAESLSLSLCFSLCLLLFSSFTFPLRDHSSIFIMSYFKSHTITNLHTNIDLHNTTFVNLYMIISSECTHLCYRVVGIVIVIVDDKYGWCIISFAVSRLFNHSQDFVLFFITSLFAFKIHHLNSISDVSLQQQQKWKKFISLLQ